MLSILGWLLLGRHKYWITYGLQGVQVVRNRISPGYQYGVLRVIDGPFYDTAQAICKLNYWREQEGTQENTEEPVTPVSPIETNEQ